MSEQLRQVAQRGRLEGLSRLLFGDSGLRPAAPSQAREAWPDDPIVRRAIEARRTLGEPSRP